MMQPQGDGARVLRVSEVLQEMDFLRFAVTVNTSPRAKGRQYLNSICAMADSANPGEQQSRRLIIA